MRIVGITALLTLSLMSFTANSGMAGDPAPPLAFQAESGDRLEISRSNATAVEIRYGQEGYTVYILLDAPTTERFAAITRANVGKPLSAIVQGKTVSRPVIQLPISSGEIVIPLNKQRADWLVDALK